MIHQVRYVMICSMCGLYPLVCYVETGTRSYGRTACRSELDAYSTCRVLAPWNFYVRTRSRLVSRYYVGMLQLTAYTLQLTLVPGVRISAVVRAFFASLFLCMILVAAAPAPPFLHYQLRADTLSVCLSVCLSCLFGYAGVV